MKDNNVLVNSRHYRLNRFASINSAKSYLEVGVANGATFFRVDAKAKTAVDPAFRFDQQQRQAEGLLFFETTSDQYFSDIVKPSDKFDLIYLDGLHTFEQTFRDFCASIPHSHERTIWLIDDTVPINMASAYADQGRFRAVKRALNEASPAWMGDVYKVVFAIHDFFPQYRFATFSSGHGQTAVWHSTRKGFSPRWNSMEAISRLDYGDFLMARDQMFFLDNNSLYQAVTEAIGVDDGKNTRD